MLNTNDFHSLLGGVNLNDSVIIIDNFLSDPLAMRALALSQTFTPDPIYPGKRSERCSVFDQLKPLLEPRIGTPIFAIESLFQYQTEEDSQHSFIHGDLCDWAGVLYLNQGHDGEPGTAFYRHLETNKNRLTLGTDLMFEAIEQGVQPNDLLEPTNRDRLDPSKWELRFTAPIRFNRLVLYDAKLFHRNASAWGNRVDNARLVQGFFISTTEKQIRKQVNVDVVSVPGVTIKGSQ